MKRDHANYQKDKEVRSIGNDNGNLKVSSTKYFSFVRILNNTLSSNMFSLPNLNLVFLRNPPSSSHLFGYI